MVADREAELIVMNTEYRKPLPGTDLEYLTDSLKQLIERRRDLDFPWYPARVVCHDILGQNALVDLAGLRDAIAEKGGDPSKVNPVVQTQLIVDHSLAVEAPGFDPDA